MNAADTLSAWVESARGLLPPGSSVWDGHTHTGSNDPDGRVSDARKLVELLDEARYDGAVVMSNADPSGYRDANDRVLEESTASAGKLVPFCRVDPTRPDAAAELTRSLDAGHRGLKLHPRAEVFSLGDPRVAPLLEEVASRGVPVLIHAGRGIPPLGPDILELLDRIAGLHVVLAHCAISDLELLAPAAAHTDGLFFDTAWWNAVDRLGLHSTVPAHRILHATDTPYGRPLSGLVMTLRTAAACGATPDQLQAIVGGTLLGLISGISPAPAQVPPTDPPRVEMELLRVHSHLHSALATILAGSDPDEHVALALAACPRGGALGGVGAALAATMAAARTAPGRRLTWDLLVVASHAALTPAVPFPDL